MNKRIIEVVDYRADWVEQFNIEKSLLMNTLDNTAINIWHIGSTSVTGLAAKPIIDILIEVKNLNELDLKNSEMRAKFYTVKGENGIAGRRYYQKGREKRTHHIHAFMQGNSAITHHLAFRDYLRQHPAVSKEYAKLKQYAAQHCEHNSTRYMQYKLPFISHHQQLALLWYGKIAQT